MKDEKCCAEVKPPEPDKLTWDQMMLEEGVYCPIGNKDVRMVVLRQGDISVVLYHEGNRLEPALPSWRKISQRFVRVPGANVCFQIKEN